MQAITKDFTVTLRRPTVWTMIYFFSSVFTCTGHYSSPYSLSSLQTWVLLARQTQSPGGSAAAALWKNTAIISLPVPHNHINALDYSTWNNEQKSNAISWNKKQKICKKYTFLSELPPLRRHWLESVGGEENEWQNINTRYFWFGFLDINLQHVWMHQQCHWNTYLFDHQNLHQVPTNRNLSKKFYTLSCQS